MKWAQWRNYLFLTVLVGGLLMGCGSLAQTTPSAELADAHTASELELPVVEPVDLQGGKLRVVATTSIIGNVAAQVGGTAVDLTVLMAAGQDPHSYQPGARELTAVADANVIFVNGWDLEEALVRALANIGGSVPIVPVSANIVPLPFGGEPGANEDHAHGGADPHVWFDVKNVEQWVKNIEKILTELDPDNGQIYAENAAGYLTQLSELETYVEEKAATIPPEKRFLVTNHGAFGYFARAYNFQIVGTVIPGLSTLSEPSASDLTDLVAVMKDHQVCTIFTETMVSDQLAQVVADELSFCDSVTVLPLYTGSLGPVGSGADTYLGFMRTNVDAITAGLQSN
ncbi:MAG: zinc ABC transporter substrate-binding protein [Ardenticatenaceae bacterium]|nr:zinc ABC transporter substrate-binding protein [Ardenticatenaceae bacterium]MCB9446298.1 zinc ABC transporter substrate-binding protein [Ardenticatenaceae bacterium]